MKLLVCALCCLVLAASPAHAFWIARPIEQRVADSDCIVLATLERVESAVPSEVFANQRATFRLVRPIKGVIGETFMVHGMKTTMCIPVVDFSSLSTTDTYLLFLGVADDKGVRFPMDASVLQIVEGKLMWADPGDKDYRLRTLQHVERSIRSIAKNPPSKRAKVRS